MCKIGMIGAGNMSYAMMGGMIGSGLSPGEIVASDINPQALEAAQEKLGIRTAPDNCAAAQGAQVIFLAVKPQYYQEAIAEIRDIVLADGKKVIVTIAPGWTLARTADAFGGACKIVRTMPNTPALVGEGMTAFCTNNLVTPAEAEEVAALLASFGRTKQLPENLFDAFTALCGSSPAFVFMMIEAMADAAVREGLPRALAYPLASQAVLGSAKMVRDLERHPGDLKDMVCSPGGTTIEGVCTLEESGMRAALIKALGKTAEKARNM